MSSAISKSSATAKRVLSGMRPTGKLHLGNYMGALKNWVDLQNAVHADGTPKYECYFFIADLHALTTDYADPSGVLGNIQQVALDFLSAGLNPEQSVVFVQSQVPGHPHEELFTLFSMFTPLGWLERVPTYKDQQEQLKEKDLNTYGFLGYPLLQAADILLYQPDYVPVGADQVAHVELTREVARRFNSLYNATCLPEPDVLLTPSPKLPGTDGRKMSKSYGNTILLSDREKEIRAKLKTMVTDPARIRRTDVGNPDICPVFDLHKVFSDVATQQTVREGCTTAGIGCIDCKGKVADAVCATLAPIQQRRSELEANPHLVLEILSAGAARASARAAVTMAEVRQVMGVAGK
jgi:tryptophanyl-tRNA synthetase